MALAVTHVLGAIIILDFFRHYVFDKKNFPRYLLVIGGIAGLAPDLDIPLSWFVNLVSGSQVNLHGGFTHSLFFVPVIALAGLILHYSKKEKWAKIFYLVAAGWSIHLALDWTYGDFKTLFWPLATPGWIFPDFGISNHSPSIDAIILVVWLIHEEWGHKIKDYF